ncbi:MAG: 2-succinyl-5-enolpyruvyl-6-hydroxy-3-cyclohexene-1-carboxylic-acid synthase [Cyanobacteriota bacterium]|nr:2-succinyl-5-enolpyruvyl-6-hydroxy-3-cyclohexene-1-carboxylic-acid synthase [Cyanobacteriota bacterium]
MSLVVSDPVPADLPGRNLQAALTLLQALAAAGLRQLVVCPGSRSAPLAVAAGLLVSRRGLVLHTAIDERSAAFFALGVGRASGVPAAVLTTSGTAVANLLPAVVEADYGTVPLLLLTADRPARLKGCGANQTVNQDAFLVANLRWLGSGHPAGLACSSAAELEELASRAFRTCSGGEAPPGPVQLNLPFEEPLHADAAALHAQLGIAGTPWVSVSDPVASSGLAPVTSTAAATAVVAGQGSGDPLGLDPDRPGIVVAGPWRGQPKAWPAFVDALRSWQRRSGWPVLADGLSSLRGVSNLALVAGYDLVGPNLPLSLRQRLRDLQVLRLGPLPASRRLQELLLASGGQQLLVSEGDSRGLDPLGRCSQQWSAGLAAWADLTLAPAAPAGPSSASASLAGDWLAWECHLQEWLDGELLGDDAPWGEPALARHLGELLPAHRSLVLANSSPVRDWESFTSALGPERTLHGCRGASGIDGTLSFACGVAAAAAGAVLLTGDLALLHDSNGWLWGSQLESPLLVVLIDNGGGGIFEQLPIRLGEGAPLDFERLFAMPQPVDQLALAAAHGVPARVAHTWEELRRELAWALEQPMALLVLRTDRRADALQRRELRRMACALADLP